MAVFKSTPITKIINGITVEASNVSVVTDASYTTTGEYTIIVRDVPKCVVTLDSKTTEHVVIKAMKQKPKITSNFNQALDIAATKTSVSKKEWIRNGDMTNMVRQKTLSDFI